MAINLSNVNITIQQFQAVSNGEYNAGEVRLTSDHSIDKVNRHLDTDCRRGVTHSPTRKVAGRREPWNIPSF